ncbi:MAG: NADH-quinone oxidoreductase subunit M [Vampirovibrio sp.]|nr:NADH-quinone oxidoreductase subunit M [Vampirovibrio sp.]
MEFLLPILVGLPFLASGVFALMPTNPNPEADAKQLHWLAGIVSVVLMGVASVLAFGQGVGTNLTWVQPWLPKFGLSLAFGQDGLTATLVLLTTLLSLLAGIASITTIGKRLKLYYSLFFLLIGSVLGVFMARDLFLFFLFFELELIPMYLLITIWGGPRRDYAAMKFVLYTLAGSIFLVASILVLASISKGIGAPDQTLFLFSQLKQVASVIATNPQIEFYTQIFIFLGFFIAFSVKLPVVPLHTWLPDAHVEAPTPISMLLAGILLKMGAYGLLRFAFEWFPLAGKLLSPYIGLLALINIVYTAAIALVQTDMKKLIAYSSVSHMGFILLALAAYNATGITAAIFVMVAHGLVSAALFMGVGTLYGRTHSREIAVYSGVAQKTPVLFYFFLLMSMSSLGLPLLVSFAGESLTFYSGFISHSFNFIPLFGYGAIHLSIGGVTALSAIGVVLGAAYMLWLVKRVFFGPVSEACQQLKDATRSEVLVLGVLSMFVIGLGFFPSLLTAQFADSTTAIASQFTQAEAQLQKLTAPSQAAVALSDSASISSNQP